MLTRFPSGCLSAWASAHSSAHGADRPHGKASASTLSSVVVMAELPICLDGTASVSEQFHSWVLEGNVRQVRPARVSFTCELLTVMIGGSHFCR